MRTGPAAGVRSPPASGTDASRTLIEAVGPSAKTEVYGYRTWLGCSAENTSPASCQSSLRSRCWDTLDEVSNMDLSCHDCCVPDGGIKNVWAASIMGLT